MKKHEIIKELFEILKRLETNLDFIIESTKMNKVA